MKWIKISDEDYRRFKKEDLYRLRIEDRNERFDIPKGLELKNYWCVILELWDGNEFVLYKFSDQEIAQKVLCSLYFFWKGEADEFELNPNYKEFLLDVRGDE